MPTIRLHLERAEFDAVARLAEALALPPEAVAYAGLDRIMLASRDPATRREITDTWEGHHDNLPLWSDSALSRHAYEGQPDDGPAPSRHL